MLLVMRVAQGIGGGALAPISQAILMESFPPRKQGIAQAIFGLGVVVAPVVGPVLGGWLTDSYSWRWIFYINIPFGLLAMWAIQKTVEDPPWVRNSDPGPLDAFGLVALSLWLGCQEVFLDKGQEDDWFGSKFISTMAGLAVCGFIVFVWRELKAEKPMVDLRLFRVRNFAVGTALIFLASVLVYGISLITPQFLQVLMGYTTLAAGIASSPLGLGAVVSMAMVGVLVARVDARGILIFGFAIFAASSFYLSRISLDISPWSIFWPLVLAGSSMGFLYVPANVAGTAPLQLDQIGSATGMLNLMRNVGGSVGIAVVSTILVRRGQVHQNMLAQHLTPSDPVLGQYVQGLKAFLFLQRPSFGTGLKPALGTLYLLLQQQSYLLAFTDVYEGLALISMGAILLVLLLHRVKAARRASRP